MTKTIEACDPFVSRARCIADRLDKIADCLLMAENQLEAIDICYGRSGVAVFFLLYGRLTGQACYVEKASSYISDSVEHLNRGYTSEDISNEIIDLGAWLSFLYKNSIIEDGLNPILRQVDAIAEKDMEIQMQKGNLTHVSGALAAGYYFLLRYHSNPNVIACLEKLLAHLDLSKVSDADDGRFFFWRFQVFNDGRIYTGIPHGLSDFIIFLYQLHRLGIQQQKCATLIRGVVGYILKHRIPDYETWRCHFPNMIGESRKMTRLSLYYGDLGVGYALLKASEVLEDQALKNEALNILTFSANRVSYETTLVEYAALIFGASGNALLFGKLYRDTGLDVFYNATDTWIDKTLGYASCINNYAGYKQFYETREKRTVKPANVGFGEGIAGIGSVLCNYISEQPLPIEHLLGIY